MYTKQQRVLSMLLLMIMMLTVLPMDVLAGTNVGGDGIISGGSGQAQQYWSITGTGSGYRFTMYWAESKDIFENPSTRYKAQRVGRTIDVISDGAISDHYLNANTYTTALSTAYNLEGPKQIPRIAKVSDAETGGGYKLYNGNVPFQVPTGGSDRWVKWFQEGEGENITYKNIDTVTRAMGNEVSNEDFKNGIQRIRTPEGDSETKQGHYELYIEPIMAGNFAGQMTIMSSRYAMMWERLFSGIQHNGKQGLNNLGFYVIGSEQDRIINRMPTAFRTFSNQVHLIKPHASIDLGTNKTNIHYTNNASFKKDLFQWKGGDPYSSMGVGVVSPDTPIRSEETVVASFVKVVGYNDGEFLYETIKESMELPVEYVEGLEDSKVIKVNTSMELAGVGDAVLNDIVTTRVNTKDRVKKEGKEVENIDWKTGLEPKVEEQKLIEDEKEVYGRLHGLVLHNIDDELLKPAQSMAPEPAEPSQSKGEAYDKYKEAVMLSKMTPLQRILYGLRRQLNDMVTPATYTTIVDETAKKNAGGYTDSRSRTATPVVKTKQIKSIEDITVGNPNAPKPSGGAGLEPSKAGSGYNIKQVEGEDTIILEPSKAGETIEDYPVVAHLRYIVIPDSKQHHVTATKENGEIILVEQEDPLPLDMPESGRPENIKLVELHELDDLVKWYTVPATGIPNLVTGYPGTLPKPLSPSEGGASGTDSLTIPEMNPGDSVIVVWEKEEFTTKLTDEDKVPEWRISKYKEEMDWGLWAGMTMTLKPDTGHGSTSLSPSGTYNFHRINPNEKRNDDSDSTTNKKFNDWLHSKTISRGSDTVTHGSPRAKIEVNGDLNLVKSTVLDGINLAKWVSTNKNRAEYDIKTDIKGVSTGSGSTQINKKATIVHSVENKDRYTHIYPVYRHTRLGGCRCYQAQETPTPRYQKAQRDIDATFDRYRQVETNNKVKDIPSVKKEENGRTTIAIQEDTLLKVYPEYPMIFQDNKGKHNIEYAIGDRVRNIKPVAYHTMEYDLKMEPKSTGTSVATDIKARQKANTVAANKQVIHKGGGVNTNFNIIGDTAGSRGKLRIKTYAIDFNNNEVKNAWGNGSYSAQKVNDSFLSKWTFKGQARENLLVQNPTGNNIVYTGPTKLKNDLAYTNKKQVKKEVLNLEVRGGELYRVDGKSIEYYKNGDLRSRNIYEALEAMKLVGANVDSTVFTAFEVKTGKPLQEALYKTEAAKARGGHDKLEIGKGWYSEDTTVLALNIIHTELDVPSNMYADKLPMTLQGLETPRDKNQFYSRMSKGYTKLRYDVDSTDLKGLGKVKSFLELTSNAVLEVQEKQLNKITVDYLVPNVSITDTMGFN